MFATTPSPSRTSWIGPTSGDPRSTHDRLYQAGTNQLSGTIERRLSAWAPDHGPTRVPHAVRGRAQAGARFALLRWWVDNDSPYSREQMDEMYHAMPLTNQRIDAIETPVC